MRFTCKAVLSSYTKRDGTRVVEMRAIIDRKQSSVSLGFTVRPDDFNFATGFVKPSCPNADEINQNIREAAARAGAVYLRFKNAGQYLTPQAFKREFIDPVNTASFTDFMAREIDLRKPKVERVSHQSHLVSLEKIKGFQPRVLFADLTMEFAQRFENFLIAQSLSANTVHKVFKHIRHYIKLAREKKVLFDSTFEKHKVKPLPPSRPALTFAELKKLFEYYRSCTIASHVTVLRYFLFSCTTGLRYSDVKRITWDNVSNQSITHQPYKTRKAKKVNTIPIPDAAVSLMGAYQPGTIFRTFSNPMSNRVLKEIASALEIKKRLVYHMSRHTFATLFLERGGQIETLNKLMDHSQITTTMVYVKVSDEKKSSEVNTAFGDLNSK